LQAASLLHDIGKLAVPEHIISKPGKLDAGRIREDEDPSDRWGGDSGAGATFRIRWCRLCARIMKNGMGSGYPNGAFEGEEIPIGARILAAVDCLDALASDRQYRRALPLNEAMAIAWESRSCRRK
jgi:hypothetical protein